MDKKIVKKHSITLKEIKKAADMVVGFENAIAAQLKLEKDIHNGVQLHRFKLTLTVYHKNRTRNLKYEFYGKNKKDLVLNMLDLQDESELEFAFTPFMII